METTLIQHADYVITVDRERRIIEDGAIAIAGNKIVEVGKTAAVAPRYPTARVIDARGKLAMPGLVDTHIHAAQQLGRGIGDERFSMERYLRVLWGFEAGLDSEAALCGFRLCMVELLRAGITCFADPGNYFPAEEAQAVRESGIRAVIARTALDIGKTPFGISPGRFSEKSDEALANSEAAVVELNGTADGRLKVWFSLRVPMACTDELLLKLAAMAEKHRVGIIGHACETPEEVISSYRKHGMSDITRLERLGILGPNMLLIHMGWINAQELLLVQKRDVKISLAPGQSFHQGQGNIIIGRAPELQEVGVTLSLGSDSAMSGNFLDVLRQASLVSGGYNEVRLDPRSLTAESVVEMATINGARATLWDGETGSLEAGKKADITILDIMRPEWQPIHNPVSNLVHCAHGGCVDTVMVDGNIVVEGGRVLTIDADDLYGEAQDRMRFIAKKSGLQLENQSLWPIS